MMIKGNPMVNAERRAAEWRRSRDGTGWCPGTHVRGTLRRLLFVAGILCALGSASVAQNLNNSGSINNNGTMKVRAQANGLPAIVDGTFEFFGANQTVPAKQYNDLVLTGTGTKTTSGGSFSVSGTVTVDPGVTLDVQPGETITLIGDLVEQGYLRGGIGKTVNLTGGTTTSNFGQIGATISWSGTAPGQTTVTRVSGMASTGNGNQSILRYYDIAPTFGSSLNGTLTFEYDPVELNGHDLNALELWRSPDGGATWRRQTSTNLPASNSIVKSGIVSFSRWTASDSADLLGPAQYEFVASALASTSGSGQSGPAGAVLAPFVVTVTDFFGNPVAGTNVTFVVDSIPTGATGYSLSATDLITNSAGQASTVLTLGNTSGLYRVRASGGGLSGSPQFFTATVTTAVASMAGQSGNNQVDTIRAVLDPIEVEVLDGSGNSVAGVAVDFEITNKPAGETGSALSSSSVTTNGFGIASTVLRLGNKIGDYEVTATTPSLPGAEIRFNAAALAGAAISLLAETGTTAQQDTILQPLDSLFAVRLTDSGGNPVSGAPVQFMVTSVPVGAAGQGLSVASPTTDSAGIASTRLTLGSKIGSYQVTATAGGLAPQVFLAIAQVGAPALLAEVSGNGQQKTVASTLDTAFTVRITDIGGNAIAGIPVQFSIGLVPTGAAGTALSVAVDTTNANGDASTVLTLGTAAGSYGVVARTAALPGDSTFFTALGSAGAAAQVLATSGDDQVEPAWMTLPIPFIVTVTDTYGNPVAGVTVQFTVTSAPAGAVGQQTSPASAATDINGQAQTTLRLGSLPGVYTTTVTVSGLPTAQFSATAAFIIADVNNDFDVNIADLTSVIDHILQKRILTGIDSIKADVNRDGFIDVLDVVVLQNTFLGMASLPKAVRPVAVGQGETKTLSAANITGTMEVTPLGLRFNLINDTPIKGIQFAVVLRSGATVNRTDVIFPRARTMQFFVNSFGNEIRMVAYNLQNAPIDTGSGSIVRLPLILADTSDVDSVYAIVSTADTSFDVAIRVPFTTTQAAYPMTFRLLQNYPNPFNTETNIVFEVPDVRGKLVRALVQVFNVLGEKVKTLAKGEHAAGQYKVIWDGTDASGGKVPSGVYFYRLVSTDYVSAKRMVLVK